MNEIIIDYDGILFDEFELEDMLFDQMVYFIGSYFY